MVLQKAGIRTVSPMVALEKLIVNEIVVLPGS